MPSLVQSEPLVSFPDRLLSGMPGPWFGGGAHRGTHERPSFAVVDPATAKPISEVLGATIEDAAHAVDLASAAFVQWSVTAPRGRAKLIRRVGALLDQCSEAFARLITLEMGKILDNSRREVELAVEYLNWFAEEALRIDGSCGVSPDGAMTMLTLRKPLGVALLVTPWNFPLVTIVRKLSACLAAGCTAIVKPSEETPLTALALAALFAEAGAPDGLLCILPTADPAPIVGHLINDTRIRKLSFTGSYMVGRVLQEQAAPAMIRTSLELGGNAPFIVFEDADLALAVDHAVVSKLSAAGQVCTAPNRFIVHRSLYDAFCARMAEIFESKRLGPGTDSHSEIGPVISERARQRIIGMIADAVQRGGRILTGGQPFSADGFFVRPTLVRDAPHESILWRNEIFGPVAQVAPFETEAEAVSLANQSRAGLAGYVYTKDVGRILRLSQKLCVGMLGVNRTGIVNAKAPFGGTALAGFGREGGHEGIEEYLDMTYVGLDRTAFGG